MNGAGKIWSGARRTSRISSSRVRIQTHMKKELEAVIRNAGRGRSTLAYPLTYEESIDRFLSIFGASIATRPSMGCAGFSITRKRSLSDHWSV